ncbi:MAG: DUF2336 domain-containing protein [Proteobacteria bacterium]|nr:DUF2336 domain-containing protein [Pseudomonadota bacterium]
MNKMQVDSSAVGGPIERMFANMPLKTRLKTAQTVAHDFVANPLEGDDAVLAESVIRYLIKDIDSAVRATVSEEVKQCDFISRDIILSLAYDIDDVSLPVITYSSLLGEDDLITILNNASEEKQIAVASRPDLDIVVTNRIAEACCYDAIEACLENESAIIGNDGYHHIIVRYGDVNIIQELLIRRPLIPTETVTRLASFLPEQHKQVLEDENTQSETLSARMIINARERVLAKGLQRRMTDHEQKKASVSLQMEGRLSATLMLRTLINDNESFFTAALAQASGISKKRVGALISGRGYLGFRRLYERAQMPQYLYTAFRTVLEEIRKAKHYHPRADKENFRQRLVDKVAHAYDFDDDLSLDDLMEKLLPKRLH